MEELQLTPQARLSPSSINEYFRDPRSYFYKYVAKIKQPLNVHLLKGSLVHEILENFFKKYNNNLEDYIFSLFNNTWDKYLGRMNSLGLSKEEFDIAYSDCHGMIIEYWNGFKRKMDLLVEVGKAENVSHAFYLLKPKFRELWVHDRELNCCGYIDRVQEGWDGTLVIADYKTSTKYGVSLSEDYRRQLSIYALLYSRVKGRTPDFVAINFLRYGETVYLEVTPKMLSYAEEVIAYVWDNTRSTDISDYPPDDPDNPTRWCSHVDESTWEETVVKEQEKKRKKVKK